MEHTFEEMHRSTFIYPHTTLRHIKYMSYLKWMNWGNIDFVIVKSLFFVKSLFYLTTYSALEHSILVIWCSAWKPSSDTLVPMCITNPIYSHQETHWNNLILNEMYAFWQSVVCWTFLFIFFWSFSHMWDSNNARAFQRLTVEEDNEMPLLLAFNHVFAKSHHFLWCVWNTDTMQVSVQCESR